MNSLIISQLDELKAYLTDQFVILFGSAVSGVMEPKLPMVDDVKRTFLRQASIQLQSGKWLERIASGYASALVDGYHNGLLRRTKFETFVWMLQSSLGKQNIDDLLEILYSCTGTQYNLNHSALAFLLQKRICLACLTTNFDNALELCLPSIQVYIHPNRPTFLPSKKERPVLIKLHGDAHTRTCVATSPELSRAKIHGLYSYIEDLLSDRVVLVLGYSGTGDIDISSHLGKKERLILWGNYSIDENGIKRPNQIDFLCDLSIEVPRQEKSGRRNLLLELATCYGWQAVHIDKDKQNREDAVRAWTRQLSLPDLSEFITTFMSWRTSWPHVHISYNRAKESQSYESKLSLAEATSQVAAYNSSEKLLTSLLMEPPPKLALYLQSVELLGFTYWRKGSYQRALSIFLTLLHLQQLAYEEWNTQLDAGSLQQVSNAARQYLETLIEMVYMYANDGQRQRLVRESQAAYVVDTLVNIQHDSDYYLNYIAILEVRYWLGEAISVEEIREFFYECMAMEEWEAAALSAHFLLTLSLSEGRKAVADVLPKLRERGAIKLAVRIRSKLRYEQLRRIVPLQVVNYRVFMGLKTLVTELVYAGKRLIWSIDRIGNISRVETGFLNFGRVSLGGMTISSWIKSHLNAMFQKYS